MEHPDIDPDNRNYDTVSPSARSLLVLKGLTSIPFARKAAELMGTEGSQIFDFKKKRGLMFWGRVVHFENRYWSIDQLLQGLNIKNILELSSGFSFRGLEMTKQKDIYYIDTDLPGLLESKKKFLAALQPDVPRQGTLETVPLNALDRTAFRELVRRFPPGPVAIVNEGLLMYLDVKEKEQVCSIIREVLQERGGYWITADIYIKRQMERYNIRMDEKEKKFFEQHGVEDKKFESLESAEAFFKKQGFVVDKVAVFDRSKVSTLKQLFDQLSFGQKLWRFLFRRKMPVIQQTWRLKPAK